MKSLKITFLLLIPAFLLACISNGNSETNESDFTILAIETRCAETPLMPRPNEPSEAVYILLDNSGSYAPYFSDAAQIAKSLLNQYLLPGDFVGISLIGFESANAVMSNTVIQHLETPKLPELTPIPPTPTPGALNSAEREYEILVSEIEDNNRAKEEAYNCAVLEWNQAYSKNEGRDNLNIFELISESVPTYSESEGTTDIQSALFNAHVFFKQARELGYSNMTLIIFSDLLDNVPPPNWSRQIDLSGVSVIAAYVPLNNVDIILESEERWNDWFELFGVRKGDFNIYIQDSSDMATLLAVLEGN